MTEPHYLGPQVAAPIAPQRSRRWLWVTVAFSAVVAAIIVLVVILTNNRFELTGSFIVMSLADDCQGSRGYDDIRSGAPVTVYSDEGKVLATGQLVNPKRENEVVCSYQINVADVPNGHDFYQVEVSHRGKTTVSNADAKSGAIGLSLGP